MANKPEDSRRQSGGDPEYGERPERPDPNKDAGSAAGGQRPVPVVGVGASAGGVGAFRTLVEHLPDRSGLAWVLIQHMAPDRESHLSEILSRNTSMPVTDVEADTPVEADRVYLVAPGRTMTLTDGRLHPVRDDSPLARRTSIDAFFLSLAEQQADNCGCALLSGAGTDGTVGLKAVKEAGGLTIIQEQQTAEYDSMLVSAVRTGLVDRELPVEEIGAAFVEFLIARRSEIREEAVRPAVRLRIADVLRTLTGHDFSGYKPNTVDRRILRRMQMRGAETPDAYADLLQGDKEEALHLFRDLLIGVTQFFRDRDAFDALRSKIIPSLLQGRTADDEVRIWVPGCATGEEVYTLAMLFQEEAEKLDSVPSLKFFGSDIDDNALHAARLGRYPAGIEADLSAERLDRFFAPVDAIARASRTDAGPARL